MTDTLTFFTCIILLNKKGLDFKNLKIIDFMKYYVIIVQLHHAIFTVNPEDTWILSCLHSYTIII